MDNIKQAQLNEITELLKYNDLPHDDIKDINLENFFGYYRKNTLEGIVGLEIFDDVALLRSLAVNEKKSIGIGTKLLNHIIDVAKENHIRTLYLLTTTADKFFMKKGFIVIDKKFAPASIQNTQEFKSLCPENAVFMKKDLLLQF